MIRKKERKKRKKKESKKKKEEIKMASDRCNAKWKRTR